MDPPGMTRCEGAYRHVECWQSQRSVVLSAASLQCSLQYLPYALSFETRHVQAGCAHFLGSVIGVLLVLVGVLAWSSNISSAGRSCSPDAARPSGAVSSWPWPRLGLVPF